MSKGFFQATSSWLLFFYQDKLNSSLSAKQWSQIVFPPHFCLHCWWTTPFKCSGIKTSMVWLKSQTNTSNSKVWWNCRNNLHRKISTKNTGMVSEALDIIWKKTSITSLIYVSHYLSSTECFTAFSFKKVVTSYLNFLSLLICSSKELHMQR